MDTFQRKLLTNQVKKASVLLLLMGGLAIIAPVRGFESVSQYTCVPPQPRVESFTGGRLDAMSGAFTRSSNFDYVELGRLRQSGLIVCQGLKDNSFRLVRGIVVCQPKDDIIVCTRYGDINIRRGAIVMLMLIDGCLGVQSLHQQNGSAVTWLAEGIRFALYPGKQLILGPREVRTFENLPPQFRQIAHRPATQVSINSEEELFYMDFSISSSLLTVAPLKQMLHSNNRQDKVAVNKILKDSVILAGLDTSRQSFDY
jgi:hypothetical protein